MNYISKIGKIPAKKSKLSASPTTPVAFKFVFTIQTPFRLTPANMVSTIKILS